MFIKKKSLLLFLLPGLGGVLIFSVIPFLVGFALSLTDGTQQLSFIGMGNYIAIFKNSMYLLGLKNTAVLLLMCTPSVCICGFVLALLLNRMQGKAGPLRTTLLLPYIIPSAAVMLVWLYLFGYRGPINKMLTFCGLSPLDFQSGGSLRVSVFLLYFWRNLGFAAVIFLSALNAVPEELYEYARLEGAGLIRQCISVAIPSVLPTCGLVVLIEIISTFGIFREAYFIGGAYPDPSVYTLQHFMNNMYSKLNYPRVTAAAYSFAAMIFGVLLLCLGIIRLTKSGREEGSA